MVVDPLAQIQMEMSGLRGEFRESSQSHQGLITSLEDTMKQQHLQLGQRIDQLSQGLIAEMKNLFLEHHIVPNTTGSSRDVHGGNGSAGISSSIASESQIANSSSFSSDLIVAQEPNKSSSETKAKMGKFETPQHKQTNHENYWENVKSAGVTLQHASSFVNKGKMSGEKTQNTVQSAVGKAQRGVLDRFNKTVDFFKGNSSTQSQNELETKVAQLLEEEDYKTTVFKTTSLGLKSVSKTGHAEKGQRAFFGRDDWISKLERQHSASGDESCDTDTSWRSLGSKRNSCRGVAFEVVRHPWFDRVSAALILGNSVLIGIETEWDAKNHGEESPMEFRILELFFTAAFTIELLLRVIAQGCLFCSPNNQDIRWNIFDTLIVASALLEEIFNLLHLATQDASVVRVLKILRLIRIVRVIRVMQFFRDLRMMIHGIMSSVKALLWVLILLLLIIFTFSCLFTQLVTDGIKEDPALLEEEEGEGFRFFQPLSRTLFSLFQVITGGIDWNDASEPLVLISPILGFIFMIYIAFAVLCVLNVVTGIFVEHAESESVLEDLVQRAECIVAMKNQLREHGFEDKEMTHADFAMFVDLNRSLFSQMGLNVDSQNSGMLFSVLDFDGSGSVDNDEFVEGCARMCSRVRSFDISTVRHDVKKCLKKITLAGQVSECRFKEMERAIGILCQRSTEPHREPRREIESSKSNAQKSSSAPPKVASITTPDLDLLEGDCGPHSTKGEKPQALTHRLTIDEEFVETHLPDRGLVEQSAATCAVPPKDQQSRILMATAAGDWESLADVEDVPTLQLRACFDSTVMKFHAEIAWATPFPVLTCVNYQGEAELRGLRAGDRIVYLNGLSTEGRSREDLIGELQKRPTTLELERKCSDLTPVEFTFQFPPGGSAGDRVEHLGIDISWDVGSWPIVSNVVEGSEAWNKGVFRGDQIQKVNGCLPSAIATEALLTSLQAKKEVLQATLTERPLELIIGRLPSDHLRENL